MITTRGDYKETVYFDSLWRSILTKREDTGSSLARYTRTEYDVSGNPTFQSLYVNNNPYKFSDPDGRFFQVVIPIVACSINAACRGAVGAAIGAAIGAARSEKGDRLTGAGKGALTLGATFVNPTLGAVTTVGVGATEGGYNAAVDGDSGTNPVTTAIGEAVESGLEVGVGRIVGKLGSDELTSGALSIATAEAVDATDVGSSITSGLDHLVNEVPRYPNGGSVRTYKREAPKPEDWIRQRRD